MQIKRFEAENIGKALKAVKKELGPDAVILETRKLGNKGQGGVQVTAAFEQAAGSHKGAPLATLPAERPATVADPPWVQEERPGKITPTLSPPAPTPKTSASPPLNDGQGLLIRSEIESALSPLRDELSGVSARLNEFRLPEPTGFDAMQSEIEKLHAMLSELVTDQRVAGMDKALRTAYASLAGRGLPRETAMGLVSKLPNGDPERLHGTLAEQVQVAGPVLSDQATPKRVMFVGPTGVGKTTTLAKIAAHYAITERRKVAMITLDTYRIGAVEQLTTYARIIGVPSATASDNVELAARLTEFADADLILIDTAGRSPKDPDHVAMLGDLDLNDVEVHLVLPATRPVEDMDAVIRAYAPLSPARLILTKLDESERLGAAVHTALTGGLPLSYLANGQRIPEDLQLASGSWLATRFLS
ncbi:MAG: flagellar biosynthesis protein FlhF [Leptospirillia bacterium]